MRINEWKDLADWLHAQGMAVYAELIWGCPGETCESFLKGYDELARHVTRIATYPLLLLPNTHYVEQKEKLEMVTWRSHTDDFERVFSHHTMSIADNRRMHGFLFWSRVVAEHLVLRYIWIPLADFASITQSQVLIALDEWLLAQSDAPAQRLRQCRDHAVEELDLGAGCIEQGLQFLFRDRDADDLMLRWWQEAIIPRVPVELRGVLQDIFRFDWMLRPVYDADGDVTLPCEHKNGERFYVRRGVCFDHDVPSILQQLSQTGQLNHHCQWTKLDFYYRPGFCNNMALYHNAQNEYYFGISEPSLDTGDPTRLAVEEELSGN